jgi:hypothetical protein
MPVLDSCEKTYVVWYITMETTAFVEKCINDAHMEQVFLPSEILTRVGMTGTKTRRFYNAICSKPDTAYLEIGTWYGSSSVSALHSNRIHATFIDNWSQFGGNKDILISALEEFKGQSTYTLIESDSWTIDHSRLGMFDVYLYDGGHTYQDHYNAISHYIQHLKDGCIVMIDDWNWEDVRKGTLDAFSNLKVEITYKKEIHTTTTHFDPTRPDEAHWWNGIGIFVIGTNQYKNA